MNQQEHPTLLRFEAAKRRKTLVDSLYRDCYEYALPHRDLYNHGVMEGQDRSIEIYDSTAVDSTDRFANTLVAAITPPEYKWSQWKAGSDVPAEERQNIDTLLEVANNRFFENLWTTNFDAVINEPYLDLAVGTGAMLIQDDDGFKPATFTPVPAAQLVIEEGPDGSVWAVFWPRRVQLRNLPHLYNVKSLPEDLEKAITKNPNEFCNVLDASYWDPVERKYKYEVFVTNTSAVAKFQQVKLHEDTYEVWPWVVVRWSKASGEHYGRGPLTKCIADVKTLNKTVELILQNGSLAIAGVYTAADDGVLNPNTIEIAPGVIIPVGYNGGVNGRSLDVLPRSGDFSVSDIILKDYRNSIKRKLYDSSPPDTVRSAEEIRHSASLIAKDLGSAWGRIKYEMVTQVVRRTAHIFAKKGLIPDLNFNGKLVKIVHRSPLAKNQEQEELGDFRAAVGDMSLVHPQAGMVALKTPETLDWIGRKHGLPPSLMNDVASMHKSLTQLGQAMAQGAVDPQAMVGK